MITEAEAKTKWCPFSFAIPEQRGHDGCGLREGGPWTCSGSQCMAWRDGGARYGPIIERIPAAPLSSRPEGFTGYQVNEDNPSAGYWIRQETQQVGYCGLAGNPEAQS